MRGGRSEGRERRGGRGEEGGARGGKRGGSEGEDQIMLASYCHGNW